jgi:hypothetical protein
VLESITDCRLFRWVENYFYYDRHYERWPFYRRERVDPTRLQWREKLAKTDVVVVEIADQLIGRAPHFDRFVGDALTALQTPLPPPPSVRASLRERLNRSRP